MESLLWKGIHQIRTQSPLVYNMTNFVVMNTTANALLATGASPIMSHAHTEVEELSAISTSLVINIGTLDEYWAQSMLMAASLFNSLGKPWILDPVGAGASSFRNAVLEELLQYKPTVIRGNASEIMALAKMNTSKTKGVDSTETSSEAIQAARHISKETNSVVCISGEVDYILHEDQYLEIHNGHPMMTKVTGLGCTASALIGACIGTNQSPFEAAASGVALLSVTGELASKTANGPASLQMQIIDLLYQLDEVQFSTTLDYKQ